MALTRETKNKRLAEKGPELLEDLGPLLLEPNILAQLAGGDRPVLLSAQQRTLACIKDEQERGSKFLSYLTSGPLTMYIDLISLLRKNRQDHIADILEGTQSPPVAAAGRQEGTVASQQACSPEDAKLGERQVLKFLVKHGPAVMKVLKGYIGPTLWRDMMAGDALTKPEVGLIQNERNDDAQVDKLLEFISDEDKFDNFREVLKEREEYRIEKMINGFVQQ